MRINLLLIFMLVHSAQAAGSPANTSFVEDGEIFYPMCGLDHDHAREGEENPQQVFKLFNSGAFGLSRRALQTDTIRYCARGSANTERKRNIDLAIKSWLFAIQLLNENVADKVVEDCTQPDVTLTFNNQSGRAFASASRVSSKVTLYSNSYYGTIFHELGHSFGLSDTYNTSGGHPNSIMKLGRAAKPMLYSDDISGIHAVHRELIRSEYQNTLTFSDRKEPCFVEGVLGVRNLISTASLTKFSRCYVPRVYESLNTAIRTSTCTDGKQRIGIVDQSTQKWIEGLGHEYSC